MASTSDKKPNAKRATRGIFERPKGSGVWWVRFHDQNGREHRQRVGAKGLAKEVYRRRKTEVAERRFFPERFRRREILLATMIDDYLTRIKHTHRSYSESERHAALWKTALGTRTLREIVAGDVERYKARRLTGDLRPVDERKGKRRKGAVLPSTINRELSFLRRIFNVAIEDGVADANPVKAKLFAKENNARVRYLTNEEEKALRNSIGGDEWLKVSFALNTGLRRAEQFELRWTSVDFDAGIITIPRSKSGKARRVPMNDVVRGLLRTLPSRLKSEWVFPSRVGTSALDAKNYVNRVFLPALEESGVTNFRWHDLRHTFASRLVMQGVDLRTVQELLGHESYEMTLRYSHLAPEHTLEAVQRLCPGNLVERVDRTGTSTGTDEKRVDQPPKIAGSKTAKAPDKAEASERAGDRGRTGDVQLGKLAFYR